MSRLDDLEDLVRLIADTSPSYSDSSGYSWEVRCFYCDAGEVEHPDAIEYRNYRKNVNEWWTTNPQPLYPPHPEDISRKENMSAYDKEWGKRRRAYQRELNAWNAAKDAAFPPPVAYLAMYHTEDCVYTQARNLIYGERKETE